MIVHLKNALSTLIKTITELEVSVGNNDVDSGELKNNDFVVGLEVHESRSKTTNDFEGIIFVNCYGKTSDMAALLHTLVYDKIEKKELENEYIKSSQIQYTGSLGDVMYNEDFELYYLVTNYKVSYRRKL